MTMTHTHGDTDKYEVD